MNFQVAADAYDRFMGRYSRLLSPQMADLAGVQAGSAQRVLDVGCGPGALTSELVGRIGAAQVAAVDPSPPFVEAMRQRHPDVEVRQASAEELPFGDETFDAALAQLVVHFMTDAVAGLREMARVTRPGGVVAACVWDYAGDRAPLTPFWRAARETDPGVDDESTYAGASEGHLRELFTAAGLREVTDSALEVRRQHASFEEWWAPFTDGVGPAGVYLAGLPENRRDALRDRARALLPPPPFEIVARAWAARGTVA